MCAPLSHHHQRMPQILCDTLLAPVFSYPHSLTRTHKHTYTHGAHAQTYIYTNLVYDDNSNSSVNKWSNKRSICYNSFTQHCGPDCLSVCLSICLSACVVYNRKFLRFFARQREQYTRERSTLETKKGKETYTAYFIIGVLRELRLDGMHSR